jgi:hypothetical protein
MSDCDYTPEEFFGRNHDIKFKFQQKSLAHCTKEGDCGFILRVTAASGEQDDSFNIQLVIDPDLYPDDIHFHEQSLSVSGNLHFTLDITRTTDNRYFKDWPVGWYGKPCRDKSNKNWCWGAIWFSDKGEGLGYAGMIFSQIWRMKSSAKIRPVVYILI